MATPKFDVELHSASECKSLAESKSYEKEVELEAIATQINIAARAGETKCLYNSVLSDNAKSELDAKGYHYYPAIDKHSSLTVITWDK